MYIERIDINSFGKLSGFSIELSDGINVIEGKNESGKSTLAEFIKFMLYGMQTKTAGGEQLSERKKYVSWSSSVASGSMTVSSDGKRILIERSLTVSTDGSGAISYRETLKMTDTETGAQLYKGKNPGDVLLGVPEDIFLGTAFVRQLGGTRVDGEKISASAENLLFSADEEVNTEKSIGRLDLYRRQLLHKNGKGGSLYEKEREKAELSLKLEEAKRTAGELIATETSIAELNESRETAKQRRDEAQKKHENYEAVKNLHRFDKLHAIEDELTALYTERETVLTEGLVGGHFPSREYVNELYMLSDGLATDSSAIASTSRQLTEAKNERGSDEDIKKRAALFSGELTADEVVAEADRLNRSLATKKQLTVAFLIAGVLLTALAAAICYTPIAGDLFKPVADSIRGMLSGIASAFVLVLIPLFVLAPFAILFVIMLAVSMRAKKKLRSFLDEYGAESVEALPIVLEDMTEAARRDDLLEGRIEALEDELDGLYASYDEKLEAASELIGERGVSAEQSEIAEKLREVLADSEEICRRETQLSLRTDEKRAARDEVMSQIGDADEEIVRRICSEISVAEYDAANYSQIKLEREYNENAVTRLTEAIHELEVKRVGLMSHREDPAELAVKLSELEAEYEKERMRYNACLLAMETLSHAGESVRESVVPRIRELAIQYLSLLTDGKYDKVSVDGTFSVTVNADGAYRELEYMSGGTSDAVYLALRLALVRILYRTTLPPMIFDEAFAHMDDTRAAAAVKMLTSGSVPQSIILTCQRREGRTVASLGVEEGKHIVI